MATGPETRAVAKILKALRFRGAYVEKIHGGAYQAAGIPDLLGMDERGGFGIEVKDPAKITADFTASEREAIAGLRSDGILCGTAGGCTPLQASHIRRILKSGNRAGVATSVAEAIEILEEAL